MTTISDVAALAGVSKATVSRTFTRPHTVSPETAQRVLNASTKLGFVPNSAARQLARGRTGIIALVVPTLSNSFFTPIISGAQARAQELDLQLTVAVHSLAAAEELASFERLSRQVDGFIVAAPWGTDDVLRTAGMYKPVVLLDRETEGMTSVIADTASAFRSLASHLIAQGHRHLCYIGGPERSWQDPLRLAAVTSAAEHLGTKITALGPCPATFEAGLAISAQVRESGATAVIPYATAIGLGVQFALLHAGVRELPVVTSESPVAEALGRAHTPVIDVDGEELGRVAVNQLAESLESPQATARRIRLRVPVRLDPADQPSV
ncbi:LacI family DNA-binding transcriptional regulator [Nesterenkonia halotolerans]|uniref:DNA-binding LacI/PurR family transcriptional regulator n=1 Tax=Nesterenkonia halotolerans TaxID=225325 RepID=A0ABR9J6A6_9MICC|nr:LacI family DNA-binding transcriptional regulator [Nesterenkonia halotolerans]MBE1514379.1 DNA-binding LacI/PurR family transcriptional regulator [Nesterenkonia halotolerans]